MIFYSHYLFGRSLLTNKPLLFIWQPDTLYKMQFKPQIENLDGNVFIRNQTIDTIPTIYWSRATIIDSQVAFISIDKIKKIYPEFSVNNRYAENVILFKSCELGYYQQLPNSDVNKTAIQLPAEVQKLLNISGKDIKYVGAYPPLK